MENKIKADVENYSSEIIDSLQIFHLLHGDLNLSLKYLLKVQEFEINKLAFKSLIIDTVSCIEEFDIFVKLLYNTKVNVRNSNNFLLLSSYSRKLLNKNKQGLRLLRNSIYAHNYRDKKNNFIDPLKLIAVSYKESPILIEEIILLAEICLLIIDLAQDSFFYNDGLAHSNLVETFYDFKKIFPVIEAKEKMVPSNYMDTLKKDIYLMKDSLKASDDNYLNIASKVKCRIISGNL